MKPKYDNEELKKLLKKNWILNFFETEKLLKKNWILNFFEAEKELNEKEKRDKEKEICKEIYKEFLK